VISIQSGNDIVVRRKVSGVSTAYTWVGISPVMMYTGLVVADTGSVDATCLYIKAPGDKIFARFQRDNFGIEYTINDELAGSLTLRELRKCDRVNIAGGGYVILRGTSTDGRMVYFRTRAYPPFPQFESDRMALSSTVESGAMTLVILSSTTYSGDSVSIAATSDGGAYTSVVVTTPSYSGDSVAITSTADSGAYTFVVVYAPTFSDDHLAMTPTVESGTYAQVVISTTSPGDSLALSSTAAGGSYP